MEAQKGSRRIASLILQPLYQMEVGFRINAATSLPPGGKSDVRWIGGSVGSRASPDDFEKFFTLC
jgi:hypothetical protein